MPEYVLIFIRSIISFVVILIIARIMGKKQISQLTFFDYVVGITIGSLASATAINQSIKIMNGIVALLVFGFIPVLLGYISMKSYKFRMLVEGYPTVLVENGQILEENLLKVKMTMDDLMLFLREKNAFKLSDVELAILETNGQMSVMKKTDAQALKPKDIGLTLVNEHRPQIVIMDGNVMEKDLKRYGYTKEWLLGEIMKKGARDFSDVFVAQIDSEGNVFVDLYHEKLKLPEIKQKPLLAAQLKKLHADLENFALQTDDPKAKETYGKEAESLKKLMENVDPFLKE
ncbi:DUF421 domain-containing protein [Radiobacillus kanasensis]|uniref:DUF421 domain-containing protein n=1 Tax=Radiobacillus kanasensis TaxID=2844358 RepID=UPI001E3276FC|nr:DUF421 domain-containing protein [Radiobacillus kanasensis]UFU00285.1 DUF421 domain-containing protein [Radiobacillus kanasensis]